MVMKLENPMCLKPGRLRVPLTAFHSSSRSLTSASKHMHQQALQLERPISEPHCSVAALLLLGLRTARGYRQRM